MPIGRIYFEISLLIEADTTEDTDDRGREREIMTQETLACERARGRRRHCGERER